MTPNDPRNPLRHVRKTRDFFIGIDSDGCVFDSMETKHKECFIPNTIKTFGLAAVSRYAREAAEFVNLYSHWRGVNRFPGLTMTLDLLARRPEVQRYGFNVPMLPGLREWIDRKPLLGNPALLAELERTKDPDLDLTYQWSMAVNRSIDETVRRVPPFPLVRESLQMMAEKADLIVVSSTPGEALEREWAENDLDRHVALIAGQELGNKIEHLTLATDGRYAKDQVLMIGDALGDFRAAKAIDALFYPILPGHEEESWRRFHDEALHRFFNGTYAGPYMADLLVRFEALLPTTPPWQQTEPGGDNPSKSA